MKLSGLLAVSLLVVSCGFDPEGVDLEGEWQAAITGIPFEDDRPETCSISWPMTVLPASVETQSVSYLPWELDVACPPNSLMTVDWRGQTLHLRRDGKTVTIMMAGEPFATARLSSEDAMTGTIADSVFIAGGADFRATR